MMGTRSGSIDPSVISFLIEQHGYTIEEIDELLNKKGFYSVSGNMIPRINQIPIYHVHGMISRDNTKPSNSVLS